MWPLAVKKLDRSPSTSLELQEKADHPCWGRRFGQGVVRLADEPRAPLLMKETVISK
jgi:hypothetical protein